MAFEAAAIKRCMLVAATLVLSLAPLHAATFSVERGINLDQWVTWPNEAEWHRADVLLPFPEWRRTVGEEELRALENGGFDFVRIPVDPLPFLSPRSTALRTRLHGSIRDAVRLVNAAGLKAIVDLHAIPRGGDRFAGTRELLEDAALFERYLGLVREMGHTLSGEDPERVAFELMNEPVIGCTSSDGETWRDRLARLHAAARSSATRLTLVLSGACWGGAEGLVSLDPKSFHDDNVIWSFHSYAPFLLTHQGARWTGDFIRHVTGIPYPPHAFPTHLDEALRAARDRIGRDAPLLRRSGMLAYLDQQIGLVDTDEELRAEMAAPFRLVAGWAARNGVAPRDILIGEFGMIRQEYGNPFIMPGQWRAAYYRDMIALAEENGFAWSLWSYGGAFGVVDEFDGRRAENDVLDMVGRLGE